MLKAFLLINIVIFFPLISFAIGPYEIPFGSYDYDTTFTAGGLDTLHNLMGFNIFVDEEIDACSTVNMLSDSGIVSVILHNDDVVKYSKTSYQWLQPESTDTEMHLYDLGGTISDGCWISSVDSVDTLYGPDRGAIGDTAYPYHKMEREYTLGAPTTGPIEYKLVFRMKIDEISNGSDTVANISMGYHTWNKKPCALSPLPPIIASDCSTDFAEISKDFEIPEYIWQCDPDSMMTDVDSVDVGQIGTAFFLITTGEREVTVDWVKIYDDFGQRLVETTEFDTLITDSAGRFSNCDDEVWGWYTRDEPYFMNLPVMGAILDTARAYGNANWRAISAINYPQHFKYWFEQIDMALLIGVEKVISKDEENRRIGVE